MQLVFAEVIKTADHSIIEGHRPKEVQNDYFNKGLSKIKWPKGKHNKTPSHAVDAPVWHKKRPHIRWKDEASQRYFAGKVVQAAQIMYELGEIDHLIRWGGDWDRDNDTQDQSFMDLVHFELYKPRRTRA